MHVFIILLVSLTYNNFMPDHCTVCLCAFPGKITVLWFHVWWHNMLWWKLPLMWSPPCWKKRRFEWENFEAHKKQKVSQEVSLDKKEDGVIDKKDERMDSVGGVKDGMNWTPQLGINVLFKLNIFIFIMVAFCFILCYCKLHNFGYR